MFEQPSKCPNPKCRFHKHPVAGFFRKRGKYKTLDGHVVQRYQCKNEKCGTTFSNRTEKAERLQRKDINKLLFGLVCSGATIRRSAKLLKVSVNTVRARMTWLAAQAKKAHFKALKDGSMLTSHVMFDEMQTYLHTKAKALTIALAVRAKTGQILSAKVGAIPAKGKLAAKGAAMGWVVNQGPQVRQRVLTHAAMSVRNDVTFSCDAYPSYPAEIKQHVGQWVTVNVYPSRKGNGFDPLFRINHICAKIRADVACMARETWTTTKTIRHLQERLDIYVAWNNGYQIT